MPRYGRYVSPSPMVGTMTNLGRANRHLAMPENGWAYQASAHVGRTTGSATYARIHLLTTSGNVPAALLAATSELSVTAAMSYGGDGQILTAALSAIVPMTSGVRYAIGLASRGGQIMHGMVGTGLPAGSDPIMYRRDSVGSTGPYNPWNHNDTGTNGHVTQWVDYAVNVKPDVPINRSPSGLLASAPSAFTGAFRDANETVNGADNKANEKLNQFRIQLREKNGVSLKWDTTLTATGGEQTGRAFSRAYGGSGTIDPGVAYEWRCSVSDAFGVWSDWSSWLEFQVGSAGSATIQPSPGVAGRIVTQTPTGFAVAYSHPAAKTTTSQNIQILAGGSVIRDQTITATHSSGDSFTLSPTWGGGGWTALSWGQAATWRWRAIDSSGDPTAWSPEVTFNTNFRPSTPSGLTPSGGAISYGWPLLTFRMNDPDNTVATGLSGEVRIKDSGSVLIATRTATLISGDTWGYQTDSGDISATDTYRWDARGTDPDLDGNWSTEVDFFFADAPIISTPTPNDIVPSSALSVGYSITGQVARRFSVFLLGGVTPVLQTSWETTGLTSATIDMSGVAVNGAQYEIMVEVELTGAVQTRSTRVPFVVIIDPAHSVTAAAGSQAVAVGGELDTSAIRVMIGTTSGINGGNFLAWRVKEGPADWAGRWTTLMANLPVDPGDALSAKATLASELVTVAESRVYAATELTYFEPSLQVARSYALTCLVQSGINQIESFPVNPFAATCSVHAVILSDPVDPLGRRVWLAYLSSAKYAPQDNRALIDTWGADRRPVSIRGSLDYRTISETYDLLPVGQPLSPKDARDALDALRGERPDGTPIVLTYRNDIGDKVEPMEIVKLSVDRERLGRMIVDVELREVRNG